MDKKQIIESYLEQHKKYRELMDIFNDLFGFTDGTKVYDYLFGFDEFMMQQTMQAVGDNYKWLEWFVYENECGEKEHEAGFETTKPIRNVEDLIKLIDTKDE